jgi:hypothetical protein
METALKSWKAKARAQTRMWMGDMEGATRGKRMAR